MHRYRYQFGWRWKEPFCRLCDVLLRLLKLLLFLLEEMLIVLMLRLLKLLVFLLEEMLIVLMLRLVLKFFHCKQHLCYWLGHI